MNLSKFTTTIGGEKNTVIVVRDTTAPVQTKSSTHHILLLDRSGSMQYSINSLIDQVIEIVDSHSVAGSIRNPDDLLSIFWFSGANQHAPVIVGSKYGEVKTVKLLDTLRTVVGATCFSESFKDVSNIIDTYASVVDNTIITLFTDGQAVVPWSTTDEEDRVHSIVYDIASRTNLAAVNTIGYGNYYNRNFLVNLSSITDQGIFVHTTNINEFLSVVTDQTKFSGELTKRSLEVIAANTDILYLNQSTSSLTTNTLDINNLSKINNTVYIVGTSIKSVAVNGETYKISSLETTTSENDKSNFFYAYAGKLFYYGKRQKSLDIIVNNLRDKYLADAVINAWTNDEVADAQVKLDNATFKDHRLVEGKAKVGYIPKKDALCVMDVFTELFNSSDDQYYIPFSDNVEKYSRITRKVTDNYDLFTPSDDKVLAPLSSFVWNKDKLNLSILFRIDGEVLINPRAAKSVNLPISYPSHIFRTHSFVKDGNLNIKIAEFQLTNELVDKLISLGVNIKSVKTDVTKKNYDSVLIDFSKLPIINRTYIDNSKSLDELHNTVLIISKTEASLKVLNNIIGTIKSNSRFNKVGAYSALTAEQIRVLEVHGIRKDGSYGGVDNKVESTANSDQYETRIMKFFIKGAASLPSIKDYESMLEGSKTVNLPGSFMIDYTRDLEKRFNLTRVNIELRDALLKEQHILDSYLTSARQNLASIKLAKALTQDFIHGLILNDKGEYTYTKNNITMVLKVDKIAEYI